MISERGVEVLANFAILRTTLFFGLIVMCCLGLCWGVATEGPIGFFRNNKELSGYLAFGLLGIPYSLWVSSFPLYQIFFRHSAAVWVEDDAVIYMNRAFLKVPLSDLRSVDIAPVRPSSSIKLIYLRLAAGRNKRIGTIFLRESQDVLLMRLKGRLCAYPRNSDGSKSE